MEINYARVESDTSSREDANQVDSQIIKTHYPRDANDKILSFVLQEDPNLCLDFTSMYLTGTVDIPTDVYPDNGFASKLFKNMSIELNSQLITSTKAV